MAVNEIFESVPTPDLNLEFSSLVPLLLGELGRQLIKLGVIGPSGDDDVFSEARTVFEGLEDLRPGLCGGEGFVRLFFLALDSDEFLQVAIAVAKQINSVLLLARAPEALHAGIA